MLADAAQGVRVNVDLIGNTGEESGRTQNGFVDLTPIGNEEQVLRPVESLDLSGLWTWQLRIGDVEDTGDRWKIHRIYVAPQRQEPMN